MRKVLLVIIVTLLTTLFSCSTKQELLLVTTTSLDNSGLLSYILPTFETAYDCNVKVVAVGTGAALELGKRGEADILIVHDEVRELAYMNEGYGEKRDYVMYNDFVFVGPSLLQATTLEDVLEEIKSNHSFYSRGDNSGTHAKEVAIWENYGFDVTAFTNWYQETGQSMGATLMMASLNSYYTLTDRGTFLSMKENLSLQIVYQNQTELKNQYSVIKVSTTLHNREDELTETFYEWILSDTAQELIGSYIKYDEQLFYPNPE